jgi:hypothetical protein
VRLIRCGRDERRGSGVCSIDAAVDCVRWYAAYIASGMLNMLTAPALTLLFLGVVVGLGTAFVWMFWEMEQSTSKPRRNGDRGG